MSLSKYLQNVAGSAPATSTAATTTSGGTGTSTNTNNAWQQALGQQGLSSSALGQYQQHYNNMYPSYTIPTLPIKLTLREVTSLMQALEKDPDLKALIVKFQPFIGIDL